LRRSNKFNLDNGGAKRARVFLSPCSPYFSTARENRNKFTWVARQAANICLWVPAAAFGVDRIAVMGFNLIGSLVGSSSATFDQSEKRANNKLVNSCSLCVVHSVGRFAALANYLKQLPLSQPQSTSVIAPSDARHCCSLIAPQTARSCQTRSLALLSLVAALAHTAHKKQTTNRTKVYGVTIGVARAQPASGERERNVLVANKFFGVISLSRWLDFAVHGPHFSNYFWVRRSLRSRKTPADGRLQKILPQIADLDVCEKRQCGFFPNGFTLGSQILC
jgi:hypothetical protein